MKGDERTFLVEETVFFSIILKEELQQIVIDLV